MTAWGALKTPGSHIREDAQAREIFTVRLADQIKSGEVKRPRARTLKGRGGAKLPIEYSHKPLQQVRGDPASCGRRINVVRAGLLALMLTTFAASAAGIRIKAEIDVGPTIIASHGSGCFISKNRIVTAWHVIEEGGKVFAEIDGNWFLCKVVKHDKKLDLALLECRGESKDIVRLAKTERLIVSASNEGEPIQDKEASNLAGTVKAKVKSGNSGGPVLNSKGELVGIILARSVDENEGMFIAADTIREFIK